MTQAELFAEVRRIEIETRRLTKQMFSGEYHSTFKGRGMAFSEVRAYQYGDDVRNIDWNVTARSQDPYIKVFEEERELTVMLLIDCSASQFFGTTTQLKSQLAAKICAVLAFSAIYNNDKVGVLLFSDKVERYIPPHKGRQQVLRIIREVIDIQAVKGETRLDLALEYFNNIQKKRTIAFILSDFVAKDYETPLRLASRRHDVVGIRISDPREQQLEDMGLVYVRDAETEEVMMIDTSSASLRAHYAKQFQTQETDFKQTFIRSGAETLNVQTSEAYVNVLRGFFDKRK
jgi:uncharacterized protein (DUF58 family)